MIKNSDSHDIDRQLGQKIRELRVKEGITQKELAGDKITRNMLSLIENGSASPSVRTLLYIAEKLGTPAGYFFSSSTADESRFLKLTVIEKLKEKFSQKKYRECRELCSSIPQNAYDDEISLILAVSSLMIAISCAEQFDMHGAMSELDSAESYASRSIYCGDKISVACNFYRELIRSSSSDAIPDIISSAESISDYVPASIVKYFIALKTIKNGENISLSFTKGSHFERHLATFMMTPIESQKKLRELSLDPALPYYMQYKVLCDLESCAELLGDIRLAYSSSRRKLELIEKFRT